MLAAAGQTAEARKLLATLKDLVHSHSAQPIYAAFIYIGLGQRNEALEELQEMADLKTGSGLDGVDQWHIFDGLHGDPRYQRLVAQAREKTVSRSLPNQLAR